jgi:small subunit ribosomal protein S19
MVKNTSFRSSARSKRKQQRKKIEFKKKEFQFHGLRIDEVKKLSYEEFLPYISSRMRRSIKRGFTVRQNKLIADIEKAEPGEVVRTHLRDMIILPRFINHKIAIYDGKEFQEIIIEPEMIGHYLGEFALTRKKVKHTGPGVGATRSSKFMPLK